MTPANVVFPDPSQADEHGLLCYGGDLSPETLLSAYRQGIFPWFNEGEPILCWSPDPRCVLFPERIRISKSMQALLKRNAFEVTFNKDFASVIRSCSRVKRKGQKGTWIGKNMILAYNKLHELGFAESVEVWEKNELVGGLYAVRSGKIVFGESMFSLKPNASKYGLISWLGKLKEEGVVLIDCQQTTKHLLSLGAEEIPRDKFLYILKQNV